MAYDIFVSYRRTDRELIASVVRRLEARGVSVWYDADIEGGADWREAIVEALTQSDMLAIFFSEDCNNSRQLKKELAVADSLGKPVVPILIEDTQPRGSFLYELADRNWVQAWPDPAARVEELVEHLATLAGKPSGAAPILSDRDRDIPTGPPIAAPRAAPAEARDDAPAAMPQAARTEAPKASDAYVGKVSQRGRKVKPTNDILPFRWIDAVVLVPLLAALGWALNHFLGGSDSFDFLDAAGTTLLLIAAVALYGALVFPFRYFMRGRPPQQALGSYLASSAILYALFLAVYLSFRYGTNVFGQEDALAVVVGFGGVWLAFTAVAFLVYGALSAHRALRDFRTNIKKI